MKGRANSVSSDDDEALDLFSPKDRKGKGKAAKEPEDLKLDDLAIEEDNWEASSKMAQMVRIFYYSHRFLVLNLLSG